MSQSINCAAHDHRISYAYETIFDDDKIVNILIFVLKSSLMKNLKKIAKSFFEYFVLGQTF